MDVKTCSKCGEAKELAGFYKHATSRGGHKSECKVCTLARQAQYQDRQDVRERRRERNSEPDRQQRLRAFQRSRRERNMAFLKEIKDSPCMDCGGIFHQAAMDFDHVRGTKKANVGNLAHQSLDRIKREIALCELVCSNCHRVRTWTRLQERKTPA